MQYHSPGPWTVARVHPLSDSDRILDAKGMIVCETNAHSMGRSDSSSANAHLIAAAPTMLSLLESIEAISDDCHCDEMKYDMIDFDAIRAAIAAATK